MEFTVASSAASTNEEYQFQVEGANLIAEKSGGKLQYNIVWDRTLGNDSELIENCMTGSIPLISLGSSPFLSYIPEIAVFDMPAVFDSVEGAHEGIGQFKDVFNDIFREKHLQIVGMSFYTFRGLSSSRSIQSRADFQGMRIRTLDNRYDSAYWKALGAQVLHMDFGELYLALQTDVIDAMENPLGVFPSSRLIELRRHIVMTNHALSVNMFVMNGEAYRALPPGHRDLLQRLMRENAEQMAARTAQDNRRLLQLVEQTHGVEIHRLSDDVQAQMAAAGEAVVDLLREDLGDALVDEFLQAVEEAEQALGVAQPLG